MNEPTNQESMASKYNSFGYQIDETPSQVDSTTANSYTADMRQQISQPDDGMICFDPDTKDLLYWNGLAWLSVSKTTSTSRIVVTVSADTTMDTTTDVVVANATSGAITIVLPSVHAMKGMEIAVVKSDNTVNVVTLQCQGSDVIGDVADTTFALGTQHSMVRLMSADSGIWLCV